MSWNCAFCVFSTILLHLLLTHINTSHNNDNNFLAYCGIDGCDRSFRKANTFARHVREKHRSYLYNNRQEVELQTLENKTGKFTLIYNYIMFVVLSTRSVFKLNYNVDMCFSRVLLEGVRFHALAARPGPGPRQIETVSLSFSVKYHTPKIHTYLFYDKAKNCIAKEPLS